MDTGDAAHPVKVTGILNLRASAHMVRVDLYSEERPLSDARLAVFLSHRLVIEIDDFLRLADEVSAHAIGIRAALTPGAPYQSPSEQARSTQPPAIGDQIG